jgi:hypothetical protein
VWAAGARARRVPLAAAAGPGAHALGRQAAPRSPPWHARAAPDGLGATPCAGVARRAGEGRWQALRRQRQGACSCLVQVGGWRGPLSEGRSAPSGPLWLRRSGPRKACGPQRCRHLPQGSVEVCGQRRSPHGQAAQPAADRSSVATQRWDSVALGCHGLPPPQAGLPADCFLMGGRSHRRVLKHVN